MRRPVLLAHGKGHDRHARVLDRRQLGGGLRDQLGQHAAQLLRGWNCHDDSVRVQQEGRRRDGAGLQLVARLLCGLMRRTVAFRCGAPPRARPGPSPTPRSDDGCHPGSPAKTGTPSTGTALTQLAQFGGCREQTRRGLSTWRTARARQQRARSPSARPAYTPPSSGSTSRSVTADQPSARQRIGRSPRPRRRGL